MERKWKGNEEEMEIGRKRNEEGMGMGRKVEEMA